MIEVGQIYEGKMNKKRIEILDIKIDPIYKTKSVIYKDVQSGKIFEYGYEAFKRCVTNLLLTCY